MDEIQRVRVAGLIDTAYDDLFAKFDAMKVTPDDLRSMGEDDLAEYFQNWLDDSDDDPTAGMTKQEIARYIAERQTREKASE